jgi:hypothetical protein
MMSLSAQYRAASRVRTGKWRISQETEMSDSKIGSPGAAPSWQTGFVQMTQIITD